MARRLTISGSTGRVRIAEINSSGTEVFPRQVYFDTNLPYLQTKGQIGPVNVTLPRIQRAYYEVPDSGSKDFGCFITTACCEVMGMSDDCRELQLLRKFRDTVMMSSITGCYKVADYYFIAPKIVEGISKKPNAEAFYAMLYKNYIKPSALAVEAEDYQRAFDLYAQGIEVARKFSGVTDGVV